MAQSTRFHGLLGAAPERSPARDAASPTSWLWPALLVASSAGGTLILACATPFAALAVIAAFTVAPSRAILATGAIWLINQGLGYGVLDYPVTLNSVQWGLAIGAAALVTTLVALRANHVLTGKGIVAALAIRLALAFAVYEAGLLLAGMALNDLEAFAPAIVIDLAILNLAWTVVLAAAHQAWTHVTSASLGRSASAGSPMAAKPRS